MFRPLFRAVFSGLYQSLFTMPGTIAPPTPPSGPWILATGFWNDVGVWDDAANWID